MWLLLIFGFFYGKISLDGHCKMYQIRSFFQKLLQIPSLNSFLDHSLLFPPLFFPHLLTLSNRSMLRNGWRVPDLVPGVPVLAFAQFWPNKLASTPMSAKGREGEGTRISHIGPQPTSSSRSTLAFGWHPTSLPIRYLADIEAGLNRAESQIHLEDIARLG